ncbi:hypothetical protein ACA910_016465 [Epithemia clementina (nom. ined.)]
MQNKQTSNLIYAASMLSIAALFCVAPQTSAFVVQLGSGGHFNCQARPHWTSAFLDAYAADSDSNPTTALSMASASYSAEDSENDPDDDKDSPKSNSNESNKQQPNKKKSSKSQFENPISEFIDDVAQSIEDVERRKELKRDLLQYGASYDRGFGASSFARKIVDSMITELESLNQAVNASTGIDGSVAFDAYGNPTESSSSPLQGNWRMIWTTAQDVLVLGASPVVTVGAIYQVFTPPIITNVIDFLPRAQALLPPSFSISSLVRAKVTTRASLRPEYPMRIGLDFEKVQLQPVELLGQRVMDSLPPLGIDLPRLSDQVLSALVGNSDPNMRPGYFDVTFLDDEMLIIRQNSPGGLFVLVKTPDNDP